MSHLHLNIFPVKTPQVEITVGVLPFDSADELQSLRTAHNGTHIFKRVRVEDRNLIYCIRMDGSPSEVSKEIREIPLQKNLGVVQIARTLESRG